ncbi:hypothetical protein CASFOL_012519 [Castilleja foliolosa]|uniref:Uncharacterized protein n=1 Tax=Castilleja foliolosa TaxID=1961234 RepID=A0ABD3DKT1_9LAMI
MSKLFMILIMLIGAICYTTTPSQAKTLQEEVDDESQFDSGEISSPPPSPSIGNELYQVPTPPTEWESAGRTIERPRSRRGLPVHHRIPPLHLPPRALVHAPSHYSLSRSPPPPPSIGNELYIVPTPLVEGELPSGTIVRPRPPRSPVHHRHHRPQPRSPPRSPPPTAIQT